MSDHIPDATKMIGETPRTDAAWKPDGGDGYPTVDVDVARQLKLELNAANERIKNLESALSTVENIDKVNAYQDLESANERIKRLEEMYEGEIGENEQFLGSNLQGLLIRELNWSKERIKRLEAAGDEAIYPLEYAARVRIWTEAKEDKP